MPEYRFSELPLSAQTAYAELAERTRAFEMGNALAGLTGSFHTLKRKGNTYWYFSYREPGVERSPVVYIGPDTEQVRTLVERFRGQRSPKALAPQALAAINLGCAAVAPKHFRVIKRNVLPAAREVIDRAQRIVLSGRHRIRASPGRVFQETRPLYWRSAG